MDQDLIVPKQNNSGFLNRKNILLIFAIVIIVEIAWAYKSLVLNAPAEDARRAVAVKPSPTTVTLTASASTVKVGQKVTVSINISSQRKVAGADLIMTYDPKFLSVEPDPKGSPVTAGTIFTDYPQNILNNAAGRITVSAITSSQSGVLGSGNFGSIVFTAKSVGQTKIAVDFTPGSTTDSNVIETKTGKDVLEKVDNVDLNITP